MIKVILTVLLDLYCAVVRPWLPAACRFHPSCGDYARKALAAHGAARGLALAARRVLRCHPFDPGGLDNVPR